MTTVLILTAQVLGLPGYAIVMARIERREPSRPWCWFAGVTLVAFIYQATLMWLVLRSL